MVVLKQTGFPSALRSLLAQAWMDASPWSCSLLDRVLWGFAGGVLWGQSGGREGFAVPTCFKMFLEVWLRIPSALRAGALAGSAP